MTPSPDTEAASQYSQVLFGELTFAHLLIIERVFWLLNTKIRERQEMPMLLAVAMTYESEQDLAECSLPRRRPHSHSIIFNNSRRASMPMSSLMTGLMDSISVSLAVQHMLRNTLRECE